MPTKNLQGRMRPVNDPYEVWLTPLVGGGLMEHRVLKKYQTPEKEAENPYARWFCAVSSPFTGDPTTGDYDMGDTYVYEVKSGAFREPEDEMRERLKEPEHQWRQF